MVTVNVNPAIALQAGTYTGQIVFTSGSNTITIPVVLTIINPGQVTFDTLPGQIAFSMATNAPSGPPSQTIQIRNAATSGSLAWTVTASTADGGSWLVPGSTTGTAPSFLTIAMVKANLPNGGATAGNFIGMLRFQSGAIYVTIPVNVNVYDDTFPQINPLSFTKVFGGANPLPQVITLGATLATNNFNVALSTFTSTGGNWLSLSGPACSGYCGTTPQNITVLVTPAVNLPVGTYTGQILITSGGQSQTVPVTLAVAAATSPVFDNMPGQLSFFVAKGATSIPGQFVDVRNAGQGTLNWALVTTTADGGNWLSTSAVAGTAPSGPIAVNVSVANLPYGGLIAGTFVGQLLFESAGSYVSVPVSVVVDDIVFEQITPLSFSKISGGANPLSQTLTIAATGAGFNYSASTYTANGGNWLSLSGNSCSGYCGGTPQIMSVIVTPAADLAAGTYTGEVIINAGRLGMSVPVTLTVRPQGTPVLDNLPGQISFSLKTQSGSPPAQTVQIRNAGTGSLDWTVGITTSDNGNWLSVDSASGTAPSSVSVSVNAANLPNGGLIAGTFTGSLTFRTSNGSTSVPVSVIVGPSVFVQLPALAFLKTFGSTTNPNPQAFTVSSTGTNFSYSVVATAANGGNWLSLSGNACSGGCGTTPNSSSAVINSDPSLAPGKYTGQIVVYTNAMAMTIPVTLTIVGQPSPSKVGVYFNTVWAVDANGNGTWDGPPGDKYFAYSAGPGDIAVVGDWTGDGHAKAGVYRNGFWVLDINGNGVYDPGVDKFFAFGGNVGEIPVVGDWNGDGRTKVGVYYKGFWTLDYNGNDQWDGATIDRFAAFGGNPGETPVLGDWNGDKRTKIGIFLNGTWQLDYNGNGQWDGPALDRNYNYTALSTDKPVVGDWTGTGTSKIGVNRNGFWILDLNGNGVYEAGVDTFYAFGGNVGEVPIVGDWTGDGKSKIGVYLHGFWLLDYNGNGQWDGPSTDRLAAIGGNTGEQLVIGKW